VPHDIESCSLTTADGLTLEAELARPAGTPRGGVVLAHPHPQQGGSMRSIVTSELFKALPERNLAVLRFNFRGVGNSEGTYGGGVAEHEDVVAAIEAMPEVGPLVLAGWSFGAEVSLTVVHPRLAGWLLIAPPLRVLPAHAYGAATDPRPKRFVIPERDQFRSPDSVRRFTADWLNTEVHAVAGADHFLIGRTKTAVDHLDEFVSTLA
jgi:uncharacterized protein